MSLKRDNSLSKDFDFENGREMDRLYHGYRSAVIPGRFFKDMLNYFMKIYKGCCGKGESINRIYHSLEQYIRINIADGNYSFADEAAKLQDLFLSVNEYSEELAELDRQLDDAIDNWFGSIHSGKLNKMQKTEDMKLFAQSTLLLNRRELVYITNRYTDFLMRGLLEYDDAPETDNDDASLGAYDLPLFTHIPVVEDISQKSLGESRLMQVLYNIVEQDSYLPMRMIHDSNNGKALVRLWKKENGEDKACLFAVQKGSVYIEKIGYNGEKSLWPGLIEAAVNFLDCPLEDIPYAVLGPELKNYDLDVLLGPNTPAVYEISQGYNDMVREYIMCYYDVYLALLGINSLLFKDTIECTRLTAAVWEVIYALVCSFDRSFDVVDPAIEFLESAIEEYKKSVQEDLKSDPASKKRLAICSTIEMIDKLGTEESEYRATPRLYFEKKLAAKVAKVLIGYSKEAETAQSLDAKTEAVLSSKSFKRLVARLNIHMMNTASEEYATALIEEMRGR